MLIHDIKSGAITEGQAVDFKSRVELKVHPGCEEPRSQDAALLGQGRRGLSHTHIAIWRALLLGVIFLASPSFANDGAADQYPGPWQEGVQIGIITSLVHARVTGCGEFYYRKSADSSDSAPQYLVYCTDDDESWTAYIVFPAIDTVLGPSSIPDDIQPP